MISKLVFQTIINGVSFNLTGNLRLTALCHIVKFIKYLVTMLYKELSM